MSTELYRNDIVNITIVNGRVKILSRPIKNLPQQLLDLKPHWCRQIAANKLNERSSNRASKHPHCLVKHLNNEQTDPKITGAKQPRVTWAKGQSLDSIWGCWFGSSTFTLFVKRIKTRIIFYKVQITSK